VINNTDERRFILLGVLLQVLHGLFGVTAIFGMFLNVTRLPKLENDVWQDHCRWQITTFWVGALLYIVTAIIGFSQGLWWPLVLAVMWVSYRIISSAIGVATQTKVPRLIGT